jgi:tyrosine-protein kinase Etk/Wzc
MEKRELTFLDFLNIIIKCRKHLIINFFIVCFIAAAISLLIPVWFTASTTILPPAGDSGGLGLSSLLGNLPVGGLGIGIGALPEETNTALAILNSRTMMENVAKKFNLKERYQTENMEETIRTLRERYSIKVNDEGTVTLYAEAKTPFLSNDAEKNDARRLAKNMANYFMEELDRLNNDIRVEKAKNSRIFIEKRYLQNLQDLKGAEENLRDFQERYGVISLPEQTEAAIMTAAELKSQIMAKEAEIGVLQANVSETHAKLVRAKTELREMEKKYDEFIYGKQLQSNMESADLKSDDLFLPFEQVPELGLQYARLYREVMMQQKLLEFLLPQYEDAKIQEAKETPTIQVLDPAVLPIKKSRPKRAIFVIIAGLVTLMISSLFLFFQEMLQILQNQDRDKYDKVNNIFTTIKRDFVFWRRKNR